MAHANYIAIAKFHETYYGKTAPSVPTEEIDNANSARESIINYIESEFSLKQKRRNSWQTGFSVKKERWLEFKNENFENSGISLSVFAEKNGNGYGQYEFCIEIETGNANKDDYKKYYKFLDHPDLLNSGLKPIHVKKSNINKYKNESWSDIKDKVEQGKYCTKGNRIRLGKILVIDENTTNDKIEDEMIKTLKSLKGYYDYILNPEAEEVTEMPNTNNTTATNTNTTEYPLNTILYGPPGTGKTYKTVEMAYDIIKGPDTNSHEEKHK